MSLYKQVEIKKKEVKEPYKPPPPPPRPKVEEKKDLTLPSYMREELSKNKVQAQNQLDDELMKS